MAMKYILYRRTSSGYVFYKCDFEDRGERITRSGLESKAVQYDANEAIDIAADREWMIQSVGSSEESPPALGIHVQDGIGSEDRIGG
jgi:hypothetical protein